MTRIGSLFTGYGGLDAAVQSIHGGTLAWYSEIEPAACRVLAAHHPDVPNLGDITQVNWEGVPPVDILTGGYPCQPFSHAGKRKGTDDERHLWPHVRDAIRVLRPRLTVLENVRGHLTLGFDAVLADLADLGLSARWGVVRAADAGAPHGRARLFVIVTDADGAGLEGADARLDVAAGRRNTGGHAAQGADGAAADAERQRHDGSGAEGAARRSQRGRADAARPAAPTPDADGHGHGREQDAAGVGRVDGGDAGPSRQRQRARGVADAGGAGAAADAEGNEQRKPAAARAVRPEPGDGADAGSVRVDWGRYAPAIERWERLTRPAPAPTIPGTNGRPRLSPRFVEWMMGLPAGHVTGHGLSAAQELKMLGNGVVPQQAALALRMLAGLPVAAVGGAGAMLPTPKAGERGRDLPRLREDSSARELATAVAFMGGDRG